MARLTIAAALVLLLVGANARGGAGSVALMETGSFHGNEVSFEARGEWFALVLEERGASLRRVTASIVSEVDPLSDGPGESTGKLVRIVPAVEAVALIRGIDELRAGPVATAVMLKLMEPANVGTTRLGADVVPARLGAHEYRFHLSCTRVAAQDPRQGSCAVTLQSGPAKTKLFFYRAYARDDGKGWDSEQMPQVIWAGDLDRDGRLDALVDTSDHYNESEITLYLSSKAAKGELVRSAASFSHVGC